jgi:MarR family transcriptional regulator, organic hydroperoxide resistance regulator
VPAAEFELDRHVFFWLTQVIGARDRELAQGLREFGLRVPEWRALAALYSRQREARGCTMSELADLATIDRTTLTRTIDRMEATGWLTRLADAEDMRVTRLALNAAGRKMFERIWPTVQRLNNLAIAGLPRSEIQLLQKILGRMRANLEAYVGETHAG